eukprot:TRINITY_DN38723_c0_g1_i1.p1 TRINITY_DN38723_c0_g1~~TRINITY_DN38723_c0_g1_i1.p1  ORF type:complete len:113 (-),score=13.66 TRINITY_DN38723_c0_g1_i1:110-448(-)
MVSCITVTLLLSAVVLVHSATMKTPCQSHAESSKRVATALQVECDEDGGYKALQCFAQSVHGNSFCQCYDENGHTILGPSRKIKACECPREKAKEKAAGLPERTCNEDGTPA